MREFRQRDLHSRAAAVAELGVEPRGCWNIIQTICHFESFLKREWSMRGGDDPPALKPDPAPVLQALEGLKLGAAECVMVGDSRPDLEAARAAGVTPVIVRYGYDEAMAQALAADPTIATIDRLALLPGLWGGAAAAPTSDTSPETAS